MQPARIFLRPRQHLFPGELFQATPLRGLGACTVQLEAPTQDTHAARQQCILHTSQSTPVHVNTFTVLVAQALSTCGRQRCSRGTSSQPSTGDVSFRQLKLAPAQRRSPRRSRQREQTAQPAETEPSCRQVAASLLCERSRQRVCDIASPQDLASCIQSLGPGLRQRRSVSIRLHAVPDSRSANGGKAKAAKSLSRSAGDLKWDPPSGGRRFLTSLALLRALPWRKFKKGSVLVIEVGTALWGSRNWFVPCVQKHDGRAPSGSRVPLCG